MRKTSAALRSPKQAHALADSNVGLVFHVAQRLTRNNVFEVCDVVGAGYCGLLRAAELFDEQRGLCFTTFAAARIKGAILDQMRECSELGMTRRIHSQHKTRAIAIERLCQKLQRPPTTRELSAELKASDRELWRQERQRIEQSPASIERDVLPDITQPVFNQFERDAEEIDIEDRFEVLRVSMKQLRQNERYVLTRHFLQGVTYTAIALEQKLSKARIMHIANAGITKLRVLMSDMEFAA